MVEPIHRAGIGRLDIAQCTYTSLGPGPHTGTSRARRKCAAARSRFAGASECRQLLAQLLAREKHARLDGSDRRIGYVRDFQQRIAHVTGKLQSQALLLRKTIEAMHHPVLNFRLQHRIDGVYAPFADASSGGMVLLPTYGLQRRAVGNAENPARHLRCPAKIVSVAPNHHERVVDDLLDILAALRESQQETSEPPLIAEI